jgi:hypothetical protein
MQQGILAVPAAPVSQDSGADSGQAGETAFATAVTVEDHRSGAIEQRGDDCRVPATLQTCAQSTDRRWDIGR